MSRIRSLYKGTVIIAGFIFLSGIVNSWAGTPERMTLDDAVAVARMQSVEALQARHSFISSYWAWRSYKASLLPSVSVYGTLMNFNRSMALLQNYEDGTLKYTSVSNLQNSLGLRLSQNIPFTGGTLSLYSDLSRIDQFGSSVARTWYAQPITLSYSQPLFAYNRFKWDKLMEPKAYESGRRKYLESMEGLTIKVVAAYFNLIIANEEKSIASQNCSNTAKMKSVAAERLKLGTVTRDEYLQLELRMLSDSISVNESAISVRKAQMELNSLLGFDESFEITPVLDGDLPAIMVDYELVLRKAMENSSFMLENELALLGAESSVAKAKADRGITMSLNARFGMSQNAPEFAGAYRNPIDQEVAGLSFSVPVFDWGLGKGKVQKARAAEEVVRASNLQKENDFRRTLFTSVGQFNTQGRQCEVSRRAMEIASERYSLMMEKFRSGGATVTDLTNAQKDNDAAVRKYVTDVRDYWNCYYTLRKYALYDFMTGKDLDVKAEEMVE